MSDNQGLAPPDHFVDEDLLPIRFKIARIETACDLDFDPGTIRAVAREVRKLIEALAARSHFGRRLRWQRVTRGWSQREAAEHCGIPQTTYSTYEAREDFPSEKALRKLAAGFMVDWEVLIGVDAKEQRE